MKLSEAVKYFRQQVKVTCTDGQVVTGKFDDYQSDAESLDEPNTIGIDNGAGIIVDIPVDEVASIAAL
ncbi:hypothetical protein I050019G5_04390 [Collinsella sp. i05-0019-G5]|jgi:hypothetical protein|uniref:hypothetical protein n=1 Tax=Collinsella sp. i05-0019-G5 TaxID=3132705 RepID=UPI002204A426|nr:MAG: hypothetical protein [Bacteriophage sp.]UWD58940.1 MAG: hypothetical protein [Bacteriophage sp.]UWG06647.1 MAG: hypothetical protein [Bacteriophage sp.]